MSLIHEVDNVYQRHHTVTSGMSKRVAAMAICHPPQYCREMTEMSCCGVVVVCGTNLHLGLWQMCEAYFVREPHQITVGSFLDSFLQPSDHHAL